MTSPPTRWLPPLLLAILTFIWGYSWVIAKQALAYVSPFMLAAHRSVLAALALLIAAKLMGKSLKLIAPREMLFIGLMQIAGFTALSNWALVAGGAGKTAVLAFTMPIWTLLLAWPLLGERVRGQQWIAAACAMGGMVLIIEPWNMHTSLFSKLLGIGAALCWAISTVLVKRLRARQAVDLLVFTGWQMLFGAMPLLLLALLVPEPGTQWNLTYFAQLAMLGLGSTALGWWIWLYLLDRLPAWEAGLSVLGTPVVAIVSSHLATGEAFSASELTGMLLIGGGLALLSVLNWLVSKRGNQIQQEQPT
jgi:drug/metabolite transporter (DMT)-like permease